MRYWVGFGVVLVFAGACGGQVPAPESSAAAVQPAQPAPLPPVRTTRALSGPDGLAIAVVEFEAGHALIDVQGSDSPLSGKVLRYEPSASGDRLRYQTQWTGRSWNVLVRTTQRYGGQTAWNAYLPEVGEVKLTYDEEGSSAVDAAAIHARHLEQQARGELEPLQRFDRAAEERKEREALAKEVGRTGEACGRSLSADVAWTTVSDAQLLDKSVSGYCDSVLYALRNACGHASGKRFVQDHVKAVRCSFDGEGRMQLKDGTLGWAIGFELMNLDRTAFAALKQLTPPGSTRSLGVAIERDRSYVCADKERSRVVIVGPREAPHGGMAYGDGKEFFRVAQPKMLSSGWFLEPRFRNDQHNKSFRGYDLRFYSYVESDPDKADALCKLKCGTREIELQRLPAAEKHKVLDAAQYRPSPHARRPYALARDQRGRYYYVDTGSTPETAKDFRLYRGKRGRVRPLAMRDVVSDSEGEIFASDNGRLRLIVGQEDAQWITKGRSTKLKRLPLQENYGLIYNELGVYLAQRLGVPCDDF